MTQVSQEAPKLMVFTQGSFLTPITVELGELHPVQLSQSKGLWLLSGWD